MQSPLPFAALLFNAFVWGLAWWPFQHMHQAGLHPLWATAFMYAVVLLALLAWRPTLWAQVRQHPELWLLALAAHPRIEAIKDCGGNTAKTQALIADGRLQVLTGEDAQIFHTLALGGAGAISACAHWQTPRFVELMALLRLGDLPAARHLWQALQPWVEACFAEPNPAPLKAMLAHAGWMRSELRAPMMPASEALQDRLKAL